MTNPVISFEFFPPKSDAAAKTLWNAVPELTPFDPQYMTVTYGAGGSTRDGTVNTLQKMIADTGIPMAAHLTFINTTKDELHKFTDQLWDMGVKHIIALRGDMPNDLQWPLDTDGDYFQYTSDFVEALKSWNDFEISVGAYPEKHPDSPSLAQDIIALQKKFEAGADRAITQFFFDNKVYFDFVEVCQQMGLNTPIVPGLLPIHDFKSMCGFAERCQAKVPDWLHEKFSGLEDKPDEARKVATEILLQQCEELVEAGVPQLHFYTLNKANITKDVIDALGLK